MEINDSMTLAGFIMLNIACIVCGEEDGYPVLQKSLEEFVSEIVSIGWQTREFPELTGPVCHNCLERPVDEQALDVNAFWGVKFNDPDEHQEVL